MKHFLSSETNNSVKLQEKTELKPKKISFNNKELVSVPNSIGFFSTAEPKKLSYSLDNSEKNTNNIASDNLTSEPFESGKP